MEQKKSVYKGLQYINVYHEDNSATSPDYFQISELPIRLTSGKNLFKLRGNVTNLQIGGYLNIEVLDYNGSPIYSEVVNYIDEDKSRIIAIYVYPDTSPGDCTITLLAEAKTVNGTAVPDEWKGRPNVKWSKKLPVNPNAVNTSEIIFETLPDVTIDEFIGVQLDRQYAISQFPTYTTGKVRYYEYNDQPILEISGGLFINDMTNGTITVSSTVNPMPTPNFTGYTTEYIGNIKKILTPTAAVLDSKYTAYSSQSIFPHTYTAFDYSPFSLSYEETPTYIETQNSQSFAFIQINALQPATGDISRIKVFSNNNGTIGTWELISDTELDKTEIFISDTASLYPDQSIGLFSSQTIINSYWESTAYQSNNILTAPTLTYVTSSLDNAVLISSSINLDNTDTVLIFKTKPSVAGIFVKNAAYQIKFDAVASKITSQPAVLSVYLSGSAFYQDPSDFYNQQFPIKFGKKIGSISISGNSQRIDDKIFNFTADYSGIGTLIFVVESGQWQISDIHVTSDADSGYTPNYTRIRCYVPTTHKSDNQLTFKIEYYNVAGEKCKQTSYVYNKTWQGGNRYIDGDYSLLTGSLYVANSLDSGIAISGYANSGYVRSLGYEGFLTGKPGFLIWSGSALSGSAGTKGGTPYSGVGLELYANTSSYFRYSTTDSEIDIRTDKFFFGNNSSSYISGSGGLIEISSSNFQLTNQGYVTAVNFSKRIIVVNDANSGSYLRTVSGGKNLVFNGALGGQSIAEMVIDTSGSFVIQDIELPNTGSSIANTVDVYIRTNGIQYNDATILPSISQTYPER